MLKRYFLACSVIACALSSMGVTMVSPTGGSTIKKTDMLPGMGMGTPNAVNPFRGT